MVPFFTKNFGNPSSRYHVKGWEADEAVEKARNQVALLIGADPGEIFFTSGATESANLAIKGVFESRKKDKNHFLTSQAEHKAVLDVGKAIEKSGARTSYLPSHADGIIPLKNIQETLCPESLMLAIMLANNETGVIQDLEAIADLVGEAGVFLFTDGTQAVGKIPVDVKKLSLDLMAFTAHKIYGPKGVGALYINKNNPSLEISAQVQGGGQEKGIRSGTLNVPGIVGFGKAAEICRLEMAAESERIKGLRDQLESGILDFGGAELNGNLKSRIPHTTNISFHDLDIEKFIQKINKYLALSTGSACTSAQLEPSHVLLSMGKSRDLALNSLRFGLGRFTTQEEMDYTLDILKKNLENFR
jgi:cysteine desulfurase